MNISMSYYSVTAEKRSHKQWQGHVHLANFVPLYIYASRPAETLTIVLYERFEKWCAATVCHSEGARRANSGPLEGEPWHSIIMKDIPRFIHFPSCMNIESPGLKGTIGMNFNSAG